MWCPAREDREIVDAVTGIADDDLAAGVSDHADIRELAGRAGDADDRIDQRAPGGILECNGDHAGSRLHDPGQSPAFFQFTALLKTALLIRVAEFPDVLPLVWIPTP